MARYNPANYRCILFDNFDQDRFTLSPDQVFTPFLVGVDLWGRQASSTHRLRDGSPELIHSFLLRKELGQSSRLQMVYSEDPSGLSLGSLRVVAIREPILDVRKEDLSSSYPTSERTRLTLNACVECLDPLTGEAVLGYTDYNFEFQEPISQYLREPDISVIVGNSIEGLVGTNSSSTITGGRHNLYEWDLVEAMINREILPTNVFIEGQFNIPAVLRHILLGNQVMQW